MSEATQENRHLAISTQLGPDKLVIESFSGTEQVGALFAFDAEVISEDPEVDPGELLGTNLTVRLELPSGETRYFNGFVSVVDAQAGWDRVGRYNLTVVPWLWFLTQTADYRMFQQKTVPDIIMQVFRDHGFTDFEDRLDGDYREWDYCVQYRETDFDFVMRLMEQEGIYYYFTHEDGKHSMVLCDGTVGHDPYPGYAEIPFHPEESESEREENIRSLVAQSRVEPRAFSTTDFDFEVPKKSLESRSMSEPTDTAPDFEIFEYPGEYLQTSEGEQVAKMRLEALICDQIVYSGNSSAKGVSAGFRLKMTEHPREAWNDEYLVLSVSHHAENPEYVSGSGGGSGPLYGCSFTLMPVERQFRLLRNTPKPIIQGPQTAIVVGKSGEEIWTDEHGRVKVLFHWDRYGKADETSSCWIRVSQEFAGKKWGSMQIPRVGHEVIVSFLEGDPDRPLITGRVYNGDNAPPYDPKQFGTVTAWKTNSSKGGGGFNELRFEDKKDEEQVFLHAQKNMDIRVLNDRFETVMNNRHLVVEVDKFDHVKNERHVTVDADDFETFGADRHVKVTGKQAQEIGDSYSLGVTGDSVLETGGNHTIDVSGDLHLKATNIVLDASSKISIKTSGGEFVLDSSGATVKGSSSVTIDGGQVKIASGPGTSADSASPGSLVAPTDATAPEDADEADPGEVAEVKAKQKETKSGKYGSVQAPPFKPPTPEEYEEKELTWIEIELLDDNGDPVPGERYEIELPDGRIKRGTLDGNGFARVEGIDPGQSKVTFPEYDQNAWESA